MVDCSSFANPLAGGDITQFLDAMLCTYAGAAGGLLAIGLIVWFTVASMSYIRTGSIVMPMVFTLLLGGAALSQLPAIGLGIVPIVLFGGGAAVIVLLLRRLDF